MQLAKEKYLANVTREKNLFRMRSLMRGLFPEHIILRFKLRALKLIIFRWTPERYHGKWTFVKIN